MRVGKLRQTLKITFTFFALVILQLSLFSGVHIAGAVSDGSEIDALIQNLEAPDVNVKADSVKALVEIGEPAVEPLIQALGAENPDIRENAAVTLGKIKDERAVQPLIEMLPDEEWEIEKAATDALIEIGEPAVEPLIVILRDENEDIFLQTKVIAVLAGIKDERAILPMIQALKEKPELQADLGYCLGLMGEPAVEPLIKALEDDNPNVRVRAAEALGILGDERAIGPLTDALNDEDETVRIFAKIGLEKIEAQKKSTLIATYGKEREFYIEDQRREWFEQLHTICDLSGDNMKLYFYPEGPVISYGCSIENCVTVGILEGSEVNNSTLHDIYSIFDQAGKETGVDDVPVVFKYEGFPREDVEMVKETEVPSEDLQASRATPGLGTIITLSGLLISTCVINRH